MAREIPEVVRAAAGLAATVLDEARKLPETLPGLPVRILGLAMQQAMKVQQHYAGLVARGDEVFTGLRGEHEPGMATFDDDEPAPATGFRGSAFDRAADTMTTEPMTTDTITIDTMTTDTITTDTITDAEVAELPIDAAADALVAAVEDLAEQVEGAQEAIEDLAGEAPSTDEILDELAIDEMVGDAPITDEPVTEDADAVEIALLESDEAPARDDAPSATAADTVDAEPTADVATTADTLTAEGEVATVVVAVTDEGIAVPETPGGDAATATDEDATTATDEGGTPVAAATDDRTDVGERSGASGSQAASVPPVDGYDEFSIAQLRGRLRGFEATTVRDLIAYEEATRAREPYLKMLRNRLERLASEQG
jgi:hypothetical protein